MHKKVMEKMARCGEGGDASHGTTLRKLYTKKRRRCEPHRTTPRRKYMKKRMIREPHKTQNKRKRKTKIREARRLV
jgi:hypothetical protein